MSQFSARGQARTLILSLLPVGVFILIEALYGTVAGIIAGAVSGVGEIAYEYWKNGRVDRLTIVSNLLVLGLGGLSLYEDNGAFFKLQPAILLFVFAAALIGSSLLGRPLLVLLAQKQRPDLPPLAVERLRGFNFRMGLCLTAIGALGAYGAFYWSTAVWATFKAVGAPVLMIAYTAIDFSILRWRMRRR